MSPSFAVLLLHVAVAHAATFYCARFASAFVWLTDPSSITYFTGTSGKSAAVRVVDSSDEAVYAKDAWLWVKRIGQTVIEYVGCSAPRNCACYNCGNCHQCACTAVNEALCPPRTHIMAIVSGVSSRAACLAVTTRPTPAPPTPAMAALNILNACVEFRQSDPNVRVNDNVVSACLTKTPAAPGAVVAPIDGFFFGRQSSLSLRECALWLDDSAGLAAAAGAVRFEFRAYDSFVSEGDANDEGSGTPWNRIRLRASDDRLSCNDTLETSLLGDASQPSTAFNAATRGLVRSVAVRWVSAASGAPLTDTMLLYFVQVTPPRALTAEERGAVEQAKVLVIGAGWSGVTAAKALVDSVAQPEDIVLLEQSEVMMGLDDILTSRALATRTETLIASTNGTVSPYDMRAATVRALVASHANVVHKRTRLREELAADSLRVVEEVTWSDIVERARITEGVVIDARGNIPHTRFRDTLLRLLLSHDRRAQRIDLFAFSYTAHTVLPSIMLLAPLVNVSVRGVAPASDTYNYTEARVVVESALHHWQQAGRIELHNDLGSAFDAFTDPRADRVSTLSAVGRSAPVNFSVALDSPKVILESGQWGTADAAIIGTLQSLRAQYLNASSRLRSILRKPPRDSVDVLSVVEFGSAVSTDDDPPEGITQFYGTPSVGWTGRYPNDSLAQFLRVDVDLRHYYPRPELDRLSQFVVGTNAAHHAWNFTLFVAKGGACIVGAAGTMSAPLSLDLVRPFLDRSKRQVEDFATRLASNRGNWRVNMVRAALLKALPLLVHTDNGCAVVRADAVGIVGGKAVAANDTGMPSGNGLHGGYILSIVLGVLALVLLAVILGLLYRDRANQSRQATSSATSMRDGVVQNRV